MIKEETYKVKVDFQNRFEVEDITPDRDVIVKGTETTIRVHLVGEKEYTVEDKRQSEKVQIVMLRGEKGEKGDPGDGDGDMKAEVYDTNGDGIVDKADTATNALKVNNHTVEADVPSDAKFTDTIYDDTEIGIELSKKADKTDIPIVPTNVSAFTNDANYQNAEQLAEAVNVKADKDSLATVATTGIYNDLKNKPVVDTELSGTSTNAVQNKVISDALGAVEDKIPTKVSDLTNDLDKLNRRPNNDCPTTDTPSEWASHLGGNVYAYTMFNTAGSFTNQPSRYGFLITFVASKEVFQIWRTQSGGPTYWRSGNASEWSGGGAFTKVLDATTKVQSTDIDWTTLMQSGEWVLVDSKYTSSNATGITFLEVAVPTALQGADVEYKLTIGAEFLASTFPSWPYLNCRKSDGTWNYNDKDFSYIRTAGVGNTAPNAYTATKVNPLAFEWVITTNNCSCTAEVIVGRAGTGNFWNAVGRAGGYSDGGASSVSLAARTQWATSISGFRIECSRNITLLNGSHMSLWARKTNVKH